MAQRAVEDPSCSTVTLRLPVCLRVSGPVMQTEGQGGIMGVLVAV